MEDQEWRQFMLSNVQKLDEAQESLSNRVHSFERKVDHRLTNLETRQSIYWGILGGLIPALVGFIFWLIQGGLNGG